MAGSNFLKHLADSLLMGLGLRTGCIDNMQKKIGMHGLKQRGLKGLDEAMG
jgi:hypothetical protein